MTKAVQKPQERVAPQPEVIPPQGTDALPQPLPGLAERWGTWAFSHREFFKGTAGSLTFRNFLRTLVAIAPYSVVNVAVQHFFHEHAAAPTASVENNFSGLWKSVWRNKVFQNTITIATSFTTFRTVSKVWNKNYDRIFGAELLSDAIAAVRDLPANIFRDVKDISPLELSATGLAAVTLAAVRGGLYPKPEALADLVPHPTKPNNTDWTKGYWRDWFSNATGYAAFFEVDDRLYNSFAKSRAQRLGKPEASAPSSTHDDQGAASRLSQDSLPRVLFRNAASVFIAAIPYIALQRKLNNGRGLAGCDPPTKPYWKNLGAWLNGFEIPFAIFTSGMEAYTRAYDKLVEKLEGKYRADEQKQQVVARA